MNRSTFCLSSLCVAIAVALFFGCNTDSTPNVKPTSGKVPPSPESTPDVDASADLLSPVRGEESMREDLIRFVQSPDRSNYLAFRSRLIASKSYDPYSDELDRASDLYEDGRIEDALATLRDAMANLILSPRAHQYLSVMYHKLGDEKAAEIEMAISLACIEGILATGNGTDKDPYVVLRTSDEYDLIDHLEKEVRSQSLTHKNGKHLDLIKCVDGSEYWFDITDAYNHLTDSFNN